MKSQEQVLAGSGIEASTVGEVIFTDKDRVFIEIIEGFIWDKYSDICNKLGVCAVGELPDNYIKLAVIEADWTLPGVGMKRLK